VARQEQEPGANAEYQQLTFGEWEAAPVAEITLDRCIITAQPTYSKKGKGFLWDCVVQALPDLFNQDENTVYHLHATAFAKEANKRHLQPGDVVQLMGIPSTQELTLQGGETQIIHHLHISALTVLSRAPRKTITVFDPKNGI
jgi:hypothetical protein